MNLDLDQYLQTLAPWEFSITVGGEEYSTRAPTVGELLVLEELAAGDSKAAKLARIKDFVVGLFDESHRPDVTSWTERALRKFVAAYIEYWKENLKKNLEAEKRAATPPPPST